ncbi:MAG: TRAP transporter TatT component family protein [Candidatus Neomarinimicrobiota bacterium]
MVYLSCAPKAILIEQPKLVSLYFEKKIKKLDRDNPKTLDEKRLLMKTKIEYGFGVIMEQADRLIDDDYMSAIKEYKRANILFENARSIGLSILKEQYPGFQSWLKNGTSITFKKEDVQDLYWLAASYGGSIKSSRGNPFEIVNLPYVGRLLHRCIEMDTGWGSGSLHSAMMSFTSTRTDLSEKVLRDSVDYYYNNAIKLSGGKDAGLYLTYAESIHKTFQEKNAFLDKLNYVLDMNAYKNSQYELTNLIAKSRAKWLISKTDEYFLE